MNTKERVYAAIGFKGVDRIPMAYRSISHVSVKLLKDLGIASEPDLLKDYRKLIDFLGADIYSHGAGPGAFSSFIPRCSAPVTDDKYGKDWWIFYAVGINSRRTVVEEYGWKYFCPGDEPPLADIETEKDIKSGFLLDRLKYFDFNNYENILFQNEDGLDPGYEDFIGYERLRSDDKDFILFGTLNQVFIICSYLRGMDQFLMDLVINKKLAEALVKEVGEFCTEFNRREVESFGDRAEWYFMWDDVAGQDGILFDPEIFRKMFLPFYTNMIDKVKSKTNLIFSWHCCGSVTKILPLMIDAGIDVFDVVQTSARDMDLENIYKNFGKSVCLHGGIDVQKLLVYGTPDQVKKEIDTAQRLWGDKGGLILAPSHDIVPGTPVENILAAYGKSL